MLIIYLNKFMVIEKLKKYTDHKIQLAFLEGIIMPNGEFVSGGNCKFLKKDDNVYIVKK